MGNDKSHGPQEETKVTQSKRVNGASICAKAFTYIKRDQVALLPCKDRKKVVRRKKKGDRRRNFRVKGNPERKKKG